MVRQLGGCAMSHPLNFPQFRSAGVSRDRFDMPYLPGLYNKPQVLRAVYIIVGGDVVFRREERAKRCVEDILAIMRMEESISHVELYSYVRRYDNITPCKMR